MENVFYHIHKKGFFDDKWYVGNAFNVGESYNCFFDLCVRFKPIVNYRNNDYSIEKLYELFSNKNSISDIIHLTDIYNSFLGEYKLLIRELGLEDIRCKHFSYVPSRQKCIWLCRKNQIDFWKNRLRTNEIVIYKIRIYDDIYKLNEEFLPNPSDSYNEILEKSKKYWSYDNKNERENDEYLYIGRIEILEEIK